MSGFTQWLSWLRWRGMTLVPLCLIGILCLSQPSFSAESSLSTLDNLRSQFANPGPEYRGKPFWSWNGDLKEDELLRQIQVLQDMGMGGFFMHSRTGLQTEYLGEEWFRLINRCSDEAEKRNLEAWLYDEDRWPSGTAGGMVTANPEYRLRFMTLRTLPASEFQWTDDIVAAFSCHLDGVNYQDCQQIQKETPANSYKEKTVLVFSIEEMEKSPFYNGYTYVDAMNLDATKEFIRLTHEKYKENCGPRIGNSIKGIFLDEPHRGAVLSSFGKSNSLPGVPWTAKLPEYFQERFHSDLIAQLPELFLRPEGRAVSPVKWQYMELTQQLFLDHFAKPILDWCHANGMLSTGHVLHEDSLTCQAAMQGSLMRFYEYMDNPGVDVLTEGNRNYWIVKQLASVARQFGQKWMLSELYGCTGWQMNFESYKAVGDWQALFGINVRCPHLSWYTMGGEAKRDYPASIFYQSAWWKEFKAVEEYFSRLGLILSQGKPCCDILVLNPIESVWCQIYDGWADGLSAADPAIRKLEKQYSELFFWLTGSHLDFDYGDEDIMARHYRIKQDEKGTPVLWIGKAPYRTVIVGGMTTIRTSTLKILDQFAKAGGKVVFLGEPPQYVDAASSKNAGILADGCVKIPWDRDELLDACRVSILEPVIIENRTTGMNASNIFCQLRSNGETKYLVAMNMDPKTWQKNITIRINGNAQVAEWDCLTGNRYAIPVTEKEKQMEWTVDFPPSGEHVYIITREPETNLADKPNVIQSEQKSIDGPFEYTLSEKNVCVLDLARYRIDEKPWRAETEVLKIDNDLRKTFGLETRSGEMVQPWFKKKNSPAPEVKGQVVLAFSFTVEQIPQKNMELALEQPECFRIRLNGHDLSVPPQTEWWIDPAIRRIPVPLEFFQEGDNEFQLQTGFKEDINIEALYMLGDFAVRLEDTKKILTPLPPRLSASDLVQQGFPFYSGAITFKVPILEKAPEGQKLFVNLPQFEAACVKVTSPGQPVRMIAWQPYEADVTQDVQNNGGFELEVVLTRRNTFGPLHQVPLRASAYGPGNFLTEGSDFTMNYQLYPAGLLKPPLLGFAAYAVDK